MVQGTGKITEAEEKSPTPALGSRGDEQRPERGQIPGDGPFVTSQARPGRCQAGVAIEGPSQPELPRNPSLCFDS